MQETWVQSLGREYPLGKKEGNPQYSCLENPRVRRAWQATSTGMQRVEYDWSNFVCNIFVLGSALLEKAMATHSSTLAWRIPGTEEPGRLPSMGSHRIRHNWRDLAAAAALLFNCYFLFHSLIQVSNLGVGISFVDSRSEFLWLKF